MSYLAVSQLGNETITTGLRVKKSCSIQAIRLKIFKFGTITDGLFTISLRSNGTILGSVSITSTELTEAIPATYAYGFVSFDFGEKGLQINVPMELDYLQCEILITISDQTIDELNYLALVRQHEFKFMEEYGDIPSESTDPAVLCWYSAYAMEVYTLNNGAY